MIVSSEQVDLIDENGWPSFKWWWMVPLAGLIVGTKVEKNSSECAICLETIKLDSLFKKHEIFKSCGHVFHKKCVKTLNKSWNSKKCPVCRSVRHS